MGDTKAPPRLRSRQCMFVLYPESQQAAIDYCKQNLPCAWALHDKDVYSQAAFDAYVKKHEGTLPDWMPGDLKKPHVHFVCSFPNARYFSGIAKEIGVEVNVIRKVNNLYKAYVYLWHLLDPDKYQYSKDIVGTHEFEEPSEHAGMSQMEDDQVQILLDMTHWPLSITCKRNLKKAIFSQNPRSSAIRLRPGRLALRSQVNPQRKPSAVCPGRLRDSPKRRT